MVKPDGQATVSTQKRRGPAPTGKGVPVGVRLQPDQLAALDAWIAANGGTMTRPEAMRALMAVGLAADAAVA